MGYYGALSPNTAIAKEAFLVNWEQGRCYLSNFVGTYRLRLPLLHFCCCACGSGAVRVALRAHAQDAPRSHEHWRAQIAWARVLLAPATLGLLHALYVVRMGGDYMHARMFLPATFAALLPWRWCRRGRRAAVSGASAQSSRLHNVLLFGCSAVVLGWCRAVRALAARARAKTSVAIGDERGWYARMAEVPNPVRIEQYEKHPFYVWGRGLVDAVRRSCPELDTAGEGSAQTGCRLTHLTPEEAREVSPGIARATPSRRRSTRACCGQVSQGAMGIAGLMLPDNVHLFDVHGLADPFVARVRAVRARSPRPRKDPARRVASGALRARRLVQTKTRASRPRAGHFAAARWRRSTKRCVRRSSVGAVLWPTLRTRVNTRGCASRRDPFVAEASYCHTLAGRCCRRAGEGGDAFHWRCPEALALTGLRGSFSMPDRLALPCARQLQRSAGQHAAAAGWGLAFGPEADAPFELTCPAGSARGGHLWARRHGGARARPVVRRQDWPAHATRLPALTRTNRVGNAVGKPFEFECPGGESVRLLRGRAGALLDALGVGCQGDATVEAR